MSLAGLRVLLTLDAIGGIWHYGMDLAQALGEQQVEAIIALIGPPPSDEQRREAQAIPRARLVETGLPLDWLCDGPTPVLATGRRLTELALDERVDLIQLNMPALAAVEQPLPVLAVAHGCIATWWEAANPGETLAPEYRWHRALMGKGLRSADRVVAPSAAYAQLVARHYGLSRVPAFVHNGRRPLVTEMLAGDDCALTVGRLWDRAKNARLLDRVAARLVVPFYAAGGSRGPHGETASFEHLQLLGQVDPAELGRRLARRPVFVSAASFEPFGLAVLEAAAAGCALVLSDIPTFRELWDEAAIFVAGEDETAFARAIERIIGDSALRLRLGHAAQARAARYTVDAMARGMLERYADVLRSGRSAGRAAA
jgi:glycosyltransferase involved in cell wall biosynthesis